MRHNLEEYEQRFSQYLGAERAFGRENCSSDS